MHKNPVFGFEKPYLEILKKEVQAYSQNVYFDEFDNLIVGPTNLGDNTILIGIEASENALLINEILENGLVKFSSYKELDKNIVHQKVVVSNKTGFIYGEEKDYKIDFGYSSDKAVSKFLKKGDTIYIKPTIDHCGDSIYTNMKCYLLKNIIVDLIKKNSNIAFAFIREGRKGAYALGKTFKSSKAYFVSLVEDSPVSFIRKEGDYISSMKIDAKHISVLKKEESLAGAYYIAGGSDHSIGIALKYQDLKNGIYKVQKADIEKLMEMCNEFIFNRD